MMKLESLNCPSCGAPLTDENYHNGKYICPYCGAHLWMRDVPEKEKTKEFQTAENRSEEMKALRVPTCCAAQNLADNQNLKVILRVLNNRLETDIHSEMLIPEIVKMLNGKKEAATECSMENDYRKVKEKLKSTLLPDENLIMYKTGAFFGFNKLKSGMFLTDKRVGYIEGKRIDVVEYKELDTFMIEVGLGETTYWYPNANEKIFVSALAVSQEELAIIIAYMILRSGEEHGQNHTILLKMKND